MKLVCLVGPTATGKTALAVSLCRKFNGEIISVDSRQAYQGMEIGTGKEIQKSKIKVQNEGIPIYLYDVLKPDEQLNAFEYSQRAWEKIQKIEGRGKVPFLVGGTGFYLDVILGRVGLSNIGADPALRTELESSTTEQLISRLRILDPDRARTVDAKNKYRLVRAIEVAFYRHGFPQGQAWKDSGSLPCGRTPTPGVGETPGLRESGRCLLIGLTAPNPRLYEMADGRVDRMVTEGLPEEVRRLANRYGWQAPGLKTLGYREFQPYFEKGADLAQVIQKIKFNTHAYIRRQKTYFKKNPEIKWFDLQESGFAQRVTGEVESFLKV